MRILSGNLFKGLSINFGWVAVLFFLLSAILRFIALNQTSMANGWDGYYYIMQVSTFFENGRMRAPDISLIYPILIAFTLVLGNPLLSLKLVSALLASGFTLLSMLVSKSLSQSKSIAFLVGAICLFSPTLTFFTSQFPKNLLALDFLLLFIYYLNRKGWIIQALWFILGFLTHRLIAVLSIVFLSVSFLKQKYLKWVFAVGVLLGLAILFLPGVIHFSDLSRFSNAFTNKVFLPPLKLIGYFGENITWLWTGELIIGYLVFIGIIGLLINSLFRKEKVSTILIAFLVALSILSLPVLTYTKANMGFRFILVFYLLIIPCIAFLKLKHHKLNYILASIFILLSLFSFKAYNPQKLDPDYQAYFRLTTQVEKHLNPEQVKLIVAHQGLAQIIITYSPFEATNWKPSKAENKGEVWRVSANISKFYFKKLLTEFEWQKVIQLDYDHFLVPEKLWDVFYGRAMNSNYEELKVKVNEWYNPSEVKPMYLLKGRSKKYIH